MQKKCIICAAEAVLCVKGMTNDCYCQECAEENFADLSYLEKIEDVKKELKAAESKEIEDDLREE